MFRFATTEIVAAAWLATLPGITSAMVDPTLPSDNSSWAASGFITPYGLGGVPSPHIPVAHPICGLKFWAVTPDSGLPPWNQAGMLAETVRAGCFSGGTSVLLTLSNCDQNARVLSAYLTQEPRRSYADMGDYACVVAELALHWSAR